MLLLAVPSSLACFDGELAISNLRNSQDDPANLSGQIATLIAIAIDLAIIGTFIVIGLNLLSVLMSRT